METELVVDFLLLRARADHAPERRLDVLPIVGPRKVGKSTLVAHACRDERVRGRFSQILFLRDRGGFTGHDDLAKFREGCETEHLQSLVPGSNDRDGGRFLLVLELAGDLDEDSWGGFYSACTRHLPSGSKIIVTSQSDTIMKFGTTTTTQALRVKFLSHEAYWYFFKTLAFGSTDPKTRPRLARLAMEVAEMTHPCLIGATMFARLLRDSSSDIRVWYKVLRFLREQRKENASRFGGHPFDLVNQRRPAYIGRMASPSEYAVFYDEQQCSSQEGVPEISAHDVMFGRVKAHGKFKVLGWRSHIPPYLSYVGTCEIQELKTTSLKRKRPCRCIED
uniref:NB-ARC domain-containing protein n=2 Tax=Zea mays TaxID=4577 RepID=A0A804Q770_MAIZE